MNDNKNDVFIVNSDGSVKQGLPSTGAAQPSSSSVWSPSTRQRELDSLLERRFSKPRLLGK